MSLANPRNRTPFPSLSVSLLKCISRGIFFPLELIILTSKGFVGTFPASYRKYFLMESLCFGAKILWIVLFSSLEAEYPVIFCTAWLMKRKRPLRLMVKIMSGDLLIKAERSSTNSFGVSLAEVDFWGLVRGKTCVSLRAANFTPLLNRTFHLREKYVKLRNK